MNVTFIRARKALLCMPQHVAGSPNTSILFIFDIMFHTIDSEAPTGASINLPSDALRRKPVAACSQAVRGWRGCLWGSCPPEGSNRKSALGLRTAIEIAGLQPVLCSQCYMDTHALHGYAHAVVADHARLRGMKKAKRLAASCSQSPAAAFEHGV